MSSMRGIYTPVTKLRRQVFTEVARLAYEGGDYSSRIEHIPYTIIPGEIPTYRESIFKWKRCICDGGKRTDHFPAAEYRVYLSVFSSDSGA